MNCAQVREVLPAHVREGDALLDVRRHLARCADCRAELERYETLVAGLSALRTAPAEPPAGLVHSLVAIPADGSRVDLVRGHLARNRGRYIGAAALVAGLAGAAVVRNRTRRVALA